MTAAQVTGPLVSFFVLAYGQEAHVRAAIESAFAQTYAPLEIILSDDCSPDGTFAVMQEMAAAYAGPHAVVLNRNPTNLGLAGHIARVMHLARGDFVVQNAGDDVSVPERTARLAEAWIAGGGRVKAVHSRVDRLDAAGGLADYPPRLPVMAGGGPAAVIAAPRHLIGASMGWERGLFEVFGPLLPGTLIEDRPIAFRAALLGEIAYLDAPLVHYRTGGASDPDGPVEGRGRAALYGYHLARRRWSRSHLRNHLADMARVPPPDAGACRELCLARLARLDFEINLAEAGLAGRLARLPAGLALALRQREPAVLRTQFTYLFDRAYMWYLDRRQPRRP